MLQPGERYRWQGAGPQFDPATGQPQFDHAMAAEMVGKYVLVGITYYADKDTAVHEHPTGHKQCHGDVVRVSEQEGIVMRLRHSGQEYVFPPDFRSLQKAEPGEYTLRSTKEVVLNPDYVCTWCVHGQGNRQQWDAI